MACTLLDDSSVYSKFKDAKMHAAHIKYLNYDTPYDIS